MADALQQSYGAASDLFIEMEAAQYTKTGQGACGDDVRFMTVEKENRHLVAISWRSPTGSAAASRRTCSRR